MSADVFQQLHVRGRAAVFDGTHQREELPQVSGRWGLSIVSILGGDAAASLDALTHEAAIHAGPGHWHSGSRGRAHVTVRALEPYSDDAPDVPRLDRSWSAFEQVVETPLRLDVRGLVLSPAGVMVRCEDLDGAADALRSAYGAAIGADGWLEDLAFANGRDPIWYCTILHFATQVLDPAGLVEWVETHAELALDDVCLDTFSLCRWDLDGLGMAPTELRRRSLPLSGR